MRVLQGTATAQQRAWAEFLLSVGEGTAPVDEMGKIRIPFGRVVESIGDLIDSVYDNIESNQGDLEYFADRAILAPTNVLVHDINRLVGARFTAPGRTFYLSTMRQLKSRPRSPYVLLRSPLIY